jgi:hypothetical protein
MIVDHWEMRTAGISHQLGDVGLVRDPRAGLRTTIRNRNRCERWIPNQDWKLDLDEAMEDGSVSFATTRVIRTWFGRFGVIPWSTNPHLLFNYDETMFAANLGRSEVIVAVDQRVFRKTHKKRNHFTLGAVFNPLGHGPLPLIVVPTFSAGEEVSWEGMH